jgi:hypothetical protein
MQVRWWAAGVIWLVGCATSNAGAELDAGDGSVDGWPSGDAGCAWSTSTVAPHDLARDVRPGIAATPDGLVAFFGHGAGEPDGGFHLAEWTPGASWTVSAPFGAHTPILSTIATPIAVGPDGTVHVVFTAWGGAIHHASRAPGGTWQDEVIATSERAAIAIDAAGTLHVAMHYLGGLAVASRPPGGAWSFDPAPDTEDSGWSPAIAVTPDGDVHVAHTYYRFDGSDDAWMYVSSRVDGVWTTEVLDLLVSDPSIAVGPGGEVQAMFYRFSEGHHQVFARRTATGWELDPRPGTHGWGTSLVIDGDGVTHTVYLREPNASAIYARRNPDGAWTEEALRTATGPFTTLALDDDGATHVVYFDAEAVVHARRCGGGVVVD